MNQRENVRPQCRLINCLWLLICCASLSGCALTHETHRVFAMAKRTTQTEPHFYEYIRSDRVAQREARLLAEQAWAESKLQSTASPDFENGFLEGFADYLYRGGSGEPPVIPPRGYWNLRFLNQFGKASVSDWYEGFRQGAQDCRSRGLREMWMVPTSLISAPQVELPSAVEWEDDEYWTDETYQQKMEERKELLKTEDSQSTPRENAEDVEDSDLRIRSEDVDEARDPFDVGGDVGEPRMQFEDAPPNLESQGTDFGGDPQDGFDDSFGQESSVDDGFDTSTEDAPLPNDGQDLVPSVDGGDIDFDGLPAGDSPLDPFSLRFSEPRENLAKRTRSSQQRRDYGVRQASSEQSVPVNKLRRSSSSNTSKNARHRRRQQSNSGANAERRHTRSSSSPRQTSGNQNRRQTKFSKDLTISESMPSLPLQVDTAKPTDFMEWDPMEGIDAPPEFDVEQFDDSGWDATSDESAGETTQWTPKMSRAAELPLHVADQRMQVAPKRRPLEKVQRPYFENAEAGLSDQLRSALQSQPRSRPSVDSRSQRHEATLPRIVDRENIRSTVQQSNVVQFRISD